VVLLGNFSRRDVEVCSVRLLAGLPPADRERVEAFSRSRPETLGAALAHLDERYGGVRAYLRDPCGLSENELTAVRTRLTGA